jgi:hypothetical protein
VTGGSAPTEAFIERVPSIQRRREAPDVTRGGPPRMPPVEVLEDRHRTSGCSGGVARRRGQRVDSRHGEGRPASSPRCRSPRRGRPRADDRPVRSSSARPPVGNRPRERPRRAPAGSAHAAGRPADPSRRRARATARPRRPGRRNRRRSVRRPS